jgi:hypothetical protein
MHSTEQIKDYVSAAINSNEILAKTTAECITSREDEKQTNIALNEIKDKIATITQDPKEMGRFIDELKKQLQEK